MAVETLVGALALPLLAYAAGSIPFGLVIARLWGVGDIRNYGSGNIGATNVRRTAGSLPGALTLLGDALKGCGPVWLAGVIWPVPLAPGGQFFLGLVAACAFAGHLYPLYLGGRKGGKGVATALGALLALSPLSLVVTLLVFVMTVCWTNRASAASLAAAAAMPLVVWQTSGSRPLTGWVLLMALGIAARHRANLRRLLRGTEPPLWQ